MANWRTPGPLGSFEQCSLDEGTLTLQLSPLPGPVCPFLAPAGPGVGFDPKAVAREKIINAVRDGGFRFRTRADWHAADATMAPADDWDYKAIAIHHAGNTI